MCPMPCLTTAPQCFFVIYRNSVVAAQACEARSPGSKSVMTRGVNDSFLRRGPACSSIGTPWAVAHVDGQVWVCSSNMEHLEEGRHGMVYLWCRQPLLIVEQHAEGKEAR